jgi:hypothetical protein
MNIAISKVSPDIKMNKKRLTTIIMLLVMPAILLGQRIEPPKWELEELSTPYSNHNETFVDAFKDPNIFIGVFEWASSGIKLFSGETIGDLPGYTAAKIRFNLSALRCVTSIKGKFDESVIFISTFGPPIFEGRPRIPSFIPLSGSKWVLALKKTSSASRLERFGKDIEKYPFLNDRTMFVFFRYGYGALCLKWPEGTPEREGLKKVPDSMVEDLEAIVKVMPYIKKEKKDANDTASINKASAALKNDLAKSIFERVSGQKVPKAQDPNYK